ncbi:MAG TPA: PD-(D/E)XK nuclease family protein [Solirubrobacteraceae bacterium]|nr:PD-(D/E)XK nuclease family protein [Solirubrobacteraceae bacterium]
MPPSLDKDALAPPGTDVIAPAEQGAIAPPDRDLPVVRDTRAAASPSGDVEAPLDKDVVAWTRLLTDPSDASAVVRALARPPIELRQVDLARVIQIARRRKLDMVTALAAAIESPHVPPEARARMQRFLELHAAAAAALDAARPDLLARAALGAEREAGPEHSDSESRQALAQALRDMQQIVSQEVLADVARIGARMGELRLDTDLDISHGIARYLELLKLSALARRPAEQSVADALEDINARLLVAATALQREILQSSPLDATLLAAAATSPTAGHEPAGTDQGEGRQARYDKQAARTQATAPRGEPSLSPFLPRRGVGLALSASDIETYRSCPLRYKFARVLRIPTAPTPGQRFGIVMHQVLERYHSAEAQTLAQLLELLDVCWRRAGFGASSDERELHAKARAALARYHAQLHGQDSEPVWFERQFSLRVGPHHLRGRVDRVDRLKSRPEAYELIDYKTSRPSDARDARDDIQLSLYALAARESWGLQTTSRAYYYVLDDLKVTLPGETDFERVRDVVEEIGESILGQRFEPTPSKRACALCDFRIVCPAAER